MGKLTLKLTIRCLRDSRGVAPFISVSLDGDMANELCKTRAVSGAPVVEYGDSFDIDLSAAVGRAVGSGRGEPRYLTLFVYDAGTHGCPPLGSCGVDMAAIRAGRIEGVWPLINGVGGVELEAEIVKVSKGRAGLAGKEGLAAGVVGGAAVGGLATALAGMAMEKKKRKSHKSGRRYGGGGGRYLSHAGGYGAGGGSSSDDDAHGNAAVRPWWDEGTSSDSDSEHENGSGNSNGDGSARSGSSCSSSSSEEERDDQEQTEEQEQEDYDDGADDYDDGAGDYDYGEDDYGGDE